MSYGGRGVDHSLKVGEGVVSRAVFNAIDQLPSVSALARDRMDTK